jgi:hypothetical protein
MGKPSPIFEQEDWQWWEDDAAEPTSSHAAVDTSFTMSNNNLILRLRINIAETNGGSSNNVTMKFEYSTNESDWYTPGASNDWDYANGQATEGDTVSGLKLSPDTDTNGQYVESSGGAGNFDYGANEDVEWDFAITPGSGVSGSTLYYFRILLDDTEVTLASGDIHPRVTTAAAGYPDLVAAQGSFSLTGQTVDPKATRKLTANYGALSLSGQTMDPKAALSLSGQTIDPKATRLLTAAQGSLVLTGQNTGLAKAYLLTAAQGSLTLTGQTINFLTTRLLSASQGSFTLSGQTANLLRIYNLIAGQGSVVLTGQTTDFAKIYNLLANQGNFNLTGQVTNLLALLKLVAAQGSFSLTGQSTNLAKAILLTAAQGSFGLTGQTVDLLQILKMAADQGSLTLTGQNTGLAKTFLSFTLTGQDVILAKTGGYTLDAAQGTFTLTGQIADLLANRILATTQGSFNLTGYALGAADWNLGVGWSISEKKAVCNGSQTGNSDLYQNINANNGSVYRVKFILSDYSAGTITPIIGTSLVKSFSSNGAHKTYIRANGDTLYMRANSDFVGKLDNISVRRIL